ncbi:MAG: hypothetical protein KME17_28905 [Cyanosarcina radialis HA8281-LM2]|jgi:hypothetical protein|nr:hypothetical protein [Cyanosarcina radialis HA8281-LM2]
MTQPNSEPFSGTIAITVQPQENGQYICHLSLSLSDRNSDEIRCCGMSREHAIAMALEKLADDYRQRAEELQNIDWDAVERSESGEPILKHYHIVLHYERIAEAKSKFEARHDTLMGNTVVENARIAAIAIEPDLPIEPLVRQWD